MVKLSTSMSPIEKRQPAWKVSTCGDGAVPIDGRGGQVGQVDGDPACRFDEHGQPGDVVAVLVADQHRVEVVRDPLRFRASRVESSRKLSPASTRMRVRPVATNVAFPELPLASTQTLRMSPSRPFLVAGKRGRDKGKGGTQNSELRTQNTELRITEAARTLDAATRHTRERCATIVYNGDHP